MIRQRFVSPPDFLSRVRILFFAWILITVVLITMSSVVRAATGDAGTTFTGVGLKISNETVPPGGMLQLKVLITEPTPILKGRQRVAFSSPMLGTTQGIAAFSPAGDVSGVAVLKNGTAQVSFSSPLSSFGTNSDYPILTMAVPVLSTATRGQKVNLTLDPNVALWFDSSSQVYPVELKSGVLTVGGSLSISNILPGGGVVPAGKVISIRGVGFQPTSVVAVNNAAIATSRYISPNEIQITLGTSVDMTARRVRVQNSVPTSETAVYYSYQRTVPVGISTNALMAASYPLFARSTWSQAYFRPVLSGTSFSGLALQNVGATAASVRLELYSNNGVLVTSNLLSLDVNRRITRRLGELLPGAVPATGTLLRVVSSTRIQMLGLLGDSASGIVLPVAPASTP
jgi:hypothetical protein